MKIKKGETEFKRLMNIGKKQKQNPWRNTRQDFEMPWNDIWASIFMAILPIMIILLASNFVIRYSGFYLFYMSKTEIIREIPYEIESEDITKTFSNYMLHKTDKFQLEEKSDYQPQQVFTQRADEIMHTYRTIADVTLIIGVLLLIASVAIVLYLINQKEKKLIFDSFKTSWIWYGALVILDAIVFLVPAIREIIFRQMFGVRFQPGDVLIQLLENQLPAYFCGWQIAATLVLMLAITYSINKLFGRRKMFKA